MNENYLLLGIIVTWRNFPNLTNLKVFNILKKRLFQHRSWKIVFQSESSYILANTAGSGYELRCSGPLDIIS